MKTIETYLKVEKGGKKNNKRKEIEENFRTKRKKEIR